MAPGSARLCSPPLGWWWWRQSHGMLSLWLVSRRQPGSWFLRCTLSDPSSHKVPDELLGISLKRLIWGVSVVLGVGCPLHYGFQLWSFLCQWLGQHNFCQSRGFGDWSLPRGVWGGIPVMRLAWGRASTIWAWSRWCETLGTWTPSTRQSGELEIWFGFAVQASSSFSGRGAVLWRLLTGSLDIFLSGGTVALMTGSPILLALGGVSDGSYLIQMLFLDLPHSFIYGTVLLLDKSLEPDLLPVAGDHKGSVILPCHLRVCAFFHHFVEALSVSDVTFFKLWASRPSRCYRVGWGGHSGDNTGSS